MIKMNVSSFIKADVNSQLSGSNIAVIMISALRGDLENLRLETNIATSQFT